MAKKKSRALTVKELVSSGVIGKTKIGIFGVYAQPGITGKPLVVFLHGQGERGSNLDLVLRYGPLRLLKDGLLPEYAKEWTILHLQLPSSYNSWPVDKVAEAIETAKTLYNSDPARVFVFGVSLGGYCLWKLASSQFAKEKIAALIIMSPGGNPGGKEAIIASNAVPIWVAHAKNDPHPAAKFITSYNAVKKINALAGYRLASLSHMGLSGHSNAAWHRFMDNETYYLWDWLNTVSRPVEEPALGLVDVTKKRNEEE